MWRRIDPLSGTWPMVLLDIVALAALMSVAKLVSDQATTSAGRWIAFLGSAAVLLTLGVAVPLRVLLLRQRTGLLTVAQQARMQAATDPLTGLPNRRTSEAFARSMLRSGVPFSVAICDLDEFKAVNDTHGHDAGDAALRLFARTMSSVVRRGDVVSRHGGEEFLVILPRSDRNGGASVLERSRLELALALSDGPCPPYTFSAGVADTTESRDWATLLHLADQRLLAAKRAGRNRVLNSLV